MKTKKEIIKELEELRNNVDMEKAHKMVKDNLHDSIYSIGVQNYDFIYEDIEYLFETYEERYTRCICNLYKELLEHYQK